MNTRTAYGRTLIIVNPHAQSGAGAAAGERLQRFLSLCLPHGSFQTALTTAPRHAIELAAAAESFDTVCALGGDGTVHEVVNGLMHIADEKRPALLVVPIGSGNDYARTLGILDWQGKDFSGILSYRAQRMDIGRAHLTAADGSAGTEYFAQTLSFGLDAAIALGTHDLRRSVKLTGNALYMLSSLEAFGRSYRTFPARVAFDGEPGMHLSPIVMAMQIGRTYGSGFDICPDADPQDGLLDICYAEGPYPRAAALGIFLAAKTGRHTGFKRVRIRRATSIAADLEGSYPIQADGERIEARHLDIDILHGALRVYQPAR